MIFKNTSLGIYQGLFFFVRLQNIEVSISSLLSENSFILNNGAQNFENLKDLFIDYLKGEVQYLCKSILLNAINNKI
jgi:hypothetical protein